MPPSAAPDLVRTLSGVDLAVLLVYLVGVTGVGCLFYWRNRSSEQYMSAGRSLPGWVVGLSIFGSYVSRSVFSRIRESPTEEIGMPLCLR